jgi:hypothetical protein
MGITQVTVAVRNPARPEKAWEALFLVDTGAVDCLVPGRHLRELGQRRRMKARGQKAGIIAGRDHSAGLTGSTR